MKFCKHCSNVYVSRSGLGLCRKCWDDPNIKSQYQPIAPFGGLQAGALGNQETDEEWIEGLLATKAASLLRELGGKNRLKHEDIVEFFGTYKDLDTWHGWIRLRRIEEKEKFSQSKINFVKLVADMCRQQTIAKSLILEQRW